MAFSFGKSLFQKLTASAALPSPFRLSAPLSTSAVRSVSSPLVRLISPIYGHRYFPRPYFIPSCGGPPYFRIGRYRYRKLLCYCGGEAVLLTSKTEKNPGREFYTCRKRSKNKCNLFIWEDVEVKMSNEYHLRKLARKEAREKRSRKELARDKRSTS